MSVETLGAASRLGFFGKLPARADFVARRLERSFTDPWDEWLQQSITAGSEALADAWLDTYLTAPIWRFLLGANVCGPAPVMGVLMPSVDRVGRYFPLTLATILTDCPTPARTLLVSDDWFACVEEIALSALEEGADFDAFDTAVGAVVAPEIDGLDGSASLRVTRYVWSLPDNDRGKQALGIVDDLLSEMLNNYSIWWTRGSLESESFLAVTAGLPSAHSFMALLDGGWERWKWGTR